MPIALIIKAIAGAAVLSGIVWIIDEIGDRREAKVRAQIAQQVAEANKRADGANAYWKSHYESQAAERLTMFGDIKTALSTQSPDVCIISDDLRTKLNSIKPRAR